MRFRRENIELIDYIESCGIKLNTNTKARGHQGFCRSDRIDISKNISKNRVVPTILHEFAHYVHHKIDKNLLKTGGSLETIFDSKDSVIFDELMKVTNFVDENSRCEKLSNHKSIIKNKILEQELIIKRDYPEFQRSKKFREFDKYIKKSKAKYLLKYDRVKLLTFFLRREEIFSIDTLEQDFPKMPPAFAAYIRLKSLQKKQANVARRIKHYKNYYSGAGELFARFVEGLYIDFGMVEKIAPNTMIKFFELLDKNFYPYLENALGLAIIDFGIKKSKFKSENLPNSQK